MDRAEETGVVGHLRHQRTFEGVHGARIGDIVNTVDRPLARLWRGAGVIDIDVTAAHFDGGMQVDNINVAINIKAELIDPVRQRGNPLAHERF